MCQNVIYFASSNLLKYAMFRASEKLLLFPKYILLTKLKSNDVNFTNYEVFDMLLWQFIAAKFEILLTFKGN